MRGHVLRDGVKFRVVQEGTGSPMVFVHGWSCNHSHFEPQLRHFARDHHVVAFDLRGHGESDKPAGGPYTIEGFADDLVWLCGELKLQKPLLVGHSMGARIALTAAARLRTAGVVLLDSTLRFLPKVAADTEKRIAAMRGSEGEAARQKMVRDVMFAPGDDVAVAERVMAEMIATPLGVAAPALASLATWDGVEFARRADAPILAILSRPLTVQSMLALVPELPRLQVAVTVGSGHFLQLIVPDQVNAMIARFMEVNNFAASPAAAGLRA
jgi:pimeloyl-ACP methyl ester carboxylesterase